MKRGRSLLGNYHWPQAQVDLAQGVHPAVVALRMGIDIDTVLETADAQGWAMSFKPSSHDDLADSLERVLR